MGGLGRGTEEHTGVEEGAVCVCVCACVRGGVCAGVKIILTT